MDYTEQPCQNLQALHEMIPDVDQPAEVRDNIARGHFRRLPVTCQKKKKFFNISLGHTLMRCNKMVIFAFTYGVVHRTPSLHLDDTIIKSAQSLPPKSFLPTQEELSSIYYRGAHLIRRILVHRFPYFEQLAPSVKAHIPHQYSDEMAQKTTVLKTSPVFADPSTTAGTIQVMRQMQNMCPQLQDGKMTIITNGDQISVERMMNAQNMVRASGEDEDLLALCPSPQEFHKEGIIFQVCY